MQKVSLVGWMLTNFVCKADFRISVVTLHLITDENMNFLILCVER